jgi:HSP20 family protein
MSAIKEAPKPKTENGPGHSRDISPRASAAPPSRSSGQFGLLRKFAREMDQLFEDFGLGAGFHVPRLFSRGHELLRREAGLVSAEWSPHVDVVARDGQLVVRADLPGLNKDDIKVEVSDGMLTLQGERKHEAKEEREGCYYSECSYGSFYRAIPLPEGADTSKATADFRNGVLEIMVPTPSKPAAKAQRVEIKEAK